MSRIIVAGALANKPGNGGEAWVRLSWVLGLRELGNDVRFVEAIARQSCVDTAGNPTSFNSSVNRTWFAKVVQNFGLSDSATLIYDDGAEFCGLSEYALHEFAEDCELLVNISGHLTYAPVFERVGRRAYVDIDPGFTQFWHADGNAGSRMRGHDIFFTIGENIGSPACSIPTCGITWHKIRPPVVLREWPATIHPHFERFTTVANWRGPFGPVKCGEVTYGLKVHEFRKFFDLPQRTNLPFEIALNIHPGDSNDREAMCNHGWQLVAPSEFTADPSAFRAYIAGSSAEFSVAQSIYVQTASGWVSDRTAHYLASGKPVLVQDTGSERGHLRGDGFLVFGTMEEAVAGAEDIVKNYSRHSRGARAMAEEYFDSKKVLQSFLETAFSKTSAPVIDQ